MTCYTQCCKLDAPAIHNMALRSQRSRGVARATPPSGVARVAQCAYPASEADGSSAHARERRARGIGQPNKPAAQARFFFFAAPNDTHVSLSHSESDESGVLP